jgi:uncharacterized membrane protein
MNGDEQTQRARDDTADASGSEGSSVLGGVRNWLPAKPTMYPFSVGTHTRYVLALSFALFVGFSVYLSLRYWSYNLTGSDFGSYVHMFASTLADDVWLEQGKYIASHPGGSYWGGHFSLTLLVFLPLFALFSSPLTLVVAKSFVLAASVIVLWVLARDRLESSRFALLVTVSYALNPFLWSAWLFDFQEQILLPPLLFGTYYAYANATGSLVWRVLFFPLLALVLLTNEFVIVLVGGFLLGAAVAAYRNNRLRERLPLLVGGAILTLAARLFSGWVIARFSVRSGIPPASIAGPIRPFVEGSYATIGELVGILLANPAVIFATLATNGFTKAVFVIMLFVPVLFLALRDETTLGALAPFLAFAWLFTGRDAYYTFDAHYPLYLLPFVYIGTVRVLARMETEHSLVAPASGSLLRSTAGSSLNATGTLLSRLFVVVLVVSAASSVAVVADKHDPLAVPDDHDELRSTALETIPPSASLVTQNDLFPHVATRPNASYIPNQGTFEAYQEQYGIPRPKYIVYDTSTAWSEVLINVYGDLLGTEYGVVAYQDGIWIYKRGYTGQPSGITTSTPRLRYGPDEFGLDGGEREGGLIVGTTESSGQTIWYGPYTILPPGTYTATFRVNTTRTTANANGPIVRLDVAAGEAHRQVARTLVPPTNGFKNVRLTFTLNETRRLVEFRGFSTPHNGVVELRSVTVTRTGPARGNATTAAAHRRPRGPNPSTRNEIDAVHTTGQ